MGFPDTWLPRLICRPNSILVERLGHAPAKSGLILPPSITSSRRSARARVHVVGDAVTDLAPGMTVLLSAGFGRKAAFGDTAAEIWLEELSPMAVMAVITEGEVDKQPPDPLRDLKPEEIGLDLDEAGRVDEGHGDALQ